MDAWESASEQIRLGHRLQQSGDLEGAVAYYQRAVALDPTSYAAYNNLGNLFASVGDHATALTFLFAAVELNSNIADIHNNIGNVYFEQEEAHAAIESYRRAIALKPEMASYHNHLGNALRLDEQYAEAESCMRTAISLRPEYAEAYVNLGFLYLEQERTAEAEEAYGGAIKVDPAHALAHTCLSRILLRRGDFRAGWTEYEWRWKWKQFPSPKRDFPQPQWRGEMICGARLFLHAEQGFGDTIQFLRYVPMAVERLAEAGTTIVLEVHPELRRMAANINGLAQVISRGDALPEFDWHCPLMSLPLAFSTDFKTTPSDVPYLLVASEAPGWLKKERKFDMHVGLVWAGSGKNRADRERSLSLSALAPLSQVEGVSFHALQRGRALEKGPDFSFASALPEVGDFADTAAAISHLDLIISVDTSVAHLAGAFGKPVWIMLPKTADWRWLMDREDSPWYPSARLFRQQIAGQWETVVDRVAAELRVAVKNRQLASF